MAIFLYELRLLSVMFFRMLYQIGQLYSDHMILATAISLFILKVVVTFFKRLFNGFG